MEKESEALKAQARAREEATEYLRRLDKARAEKELREKETREALLKTQLEKEKFHSRVAPTKRRKG